MFHAVQGRELFRRTAIAVTRGVGHISAPNEKGGSIRVSPISTTAGEFRSANYQFASAIARTERGLPVWGIPVIGAICNVAL
jgi:hypothetical protein